MTEKKTKPLALNKEEIDNLSRDEAKHVLGGKPVYRPIKVNTEDCAPTWWIPCASLQRECSNGPSCG